MLSQDAPPAMNNNHSTATSDQPNGLPTSSLSPKRILFLDAYDSFSNNITSLLETTINHPVQVYSLHIDLTTPSFSSEPPWRHSSFLDRLATFDAVVCGPGPGNPTNAADVGVVNLLWQLQQRHLVPVLGICLGFQSLVESAGGKVRRLKRGLHGMVREVEHRQTGIFRDVGRFKATLYHSLCVDVGQDDIPAGEWRERKWALGAEGGGIPDLEPLAWLDEDGERILMGVRHKAKPFWALQYHPESVCTEDMAHEVVTNWFDDAMEWNKSNNRQRKWCAGDGWRPDRDIQEESGQNFFSRINELGQYLRDPVAGDETYSFQALQIPPGLDTGDILEILGLPKNDSIVLDSSSQFNGDPLAECSIIALDVDRALKFEYRVRQNHVKIQCQGNDRYQKFEHCVPLPASVDAATPWDLLTDFWRQNSPVRNGEILAPCYFRGGFMGFVTYEMGLQGISPGVVPLDREHERPDVAFAWVTKSIVLDHKTGKAYLQHIGGSVQRNDWLNDLRSKLQGSDLWQNPDSHMASTNRRQNYQIKNGRTPEDLFAEIACGVKGLGFHLPDSGDYEEAVKACQEYISAGDSYELCLTGESDLIRSRPTHREETNGHYQETPHTGFLSNPWQIYQTLRSRQPAPFGSFIRMSGLTFLSSSPERFLRHDARGQCSMRPMKGTVRKSKAVSTLAQAEAVLHIPKEIAENLMIVDLVRHDLHGICGSGRVAVPELLKVEEYATVFTMITNVTGNIGMKRLASALDRSKKPFHGLHVLGSVLPPGSMTGAPKKRSCEILSKLEGRERSVYSGVVGYFDITGQADWSVTIRTMWKWDDELQRGEDGKEREVWHIGAGGAVTILSTPEGEREEMLTKLNGPLGVFRDAA